MVSLLALFVFSFVKLIAAAAAAAASGKSVSHQLISSASQFSQSVQPSQSVSHT